MTRHYRILAVALTLGLASTAFAQASNPNSRGGADRDPFGAGSITSGPHSTVGSNTFGQSGLARPAPRTTVATVTPVPEPSQWAMMLAGLGLVGWMVRRNTKQRR
ncbi:MAG: PEPxxWA-CTERM sorting domain-containing protein [Usitatibacter sp.]